MRVLLVKRVGRPSHPLLPSVRNSRQGQVQFRGALVHQPRSLSHASRGGTAGGFHLIQLLPCRIILAMNLLRSLPHETADNFLHCYGLN